MKRLLTIAVLALSSEPAVAGWVALDDRYQSPGLQTVYVDPTAMQREGNRVTIWQLTDYTWMQGSRKMLRFLSTTTQKQFNCAAKRLRVLAFTQFSRRMGTGTPLNGYVDRDQWRPVEPEGIDHALWELACRKP